MNLLKSVFIHIWRWKRAKKTKDLVLMFQSLKVLKHMKFVVSGEHFETGASTRRSDMVARTYGLNKKNQQKKFKSIHEETKGLLE